MGKPQNARAKPLAEATKQRARLAAARADVAEVKARKLRGELVEAAEVEREWAEVLRSVRARVARPAKPRGAAVAAPQRVRYRDDRRSRSGKRWPSWAATACTDTEAKGLGKAK